MPRPTRGDEPMTRRQLFLPVEMWEQLEGYAVELAQRERKPVSVSEALRRIVERSLKRRETR